VTEHSAALWTWTCSRRGFFKRLQQLVETWDCETVPEYKSTGKWTRQWRNPEGATMLQSADKYTSMEYSRRSYRPRDHYEHWSFAAIALTPLVCHSHEGFALLSVSQWLMNRLHFTHLVCSDDPQSILGRTVLEVVDPQSRL